MNHETIFFLGLDKIKRLQDDHENVYNVAITIIEDFF
jgi:hypothetical protein